VGLSLVGDTYELEMDSAILDAIGRLNKQDKAEVAHFIIDPVVLFILGTTSRRCLTVSEMAPSINLPIATCYKLVYQLEAFGLMSKVGVSRTSGRGKASTYTSILKSLNLELKNGFILMTVTWKNNQRESFRRELNTEPTNTAFALLVSPLDTSIAEEYIEPRYRGYLNQPKNIGATE
jgi:hypothetical protein